MSEKYAKFLSDSSNLTELLKVSDAEDLDIIVDYITDKGAGRLALNGDVCRQLVASKNAGVYTGSDLYLIEKEIMLFGGNTVANIYRDLRASVDIGGLLDAVLPGDVFNSTIRYRELAADVGKKLKVNFSESDDSIAIERAILSKLFSQALERMSEEERDAILKELGIANMTLAGPAAIAALITAGRLGGFMTYRIAVIVANAVARFILGRGIYGPTITKTVATFLGPVGWVITGLWTLADLTSPAYRVVIPCVVQLSYMRQKAIVNATTKVCGKCGTPNDLSTKFCSECGNSLVG